MMTKARLCEFEKAMNLRPLARIDARELIAEVRRLQQQLHEAEERAAGDDATFKRLLDERTEADRQRDAALADRDALQKSLDSWIAWAQSSRCIYCDQEFIHDPHDQASADKAKKTHVLTCAKHPMAEARRVLRLVDKQARRECPVCFSPGWVHGPDCALAAVLAQEEQ